MPNTGKTSLPSGSPPATSDKGEAKPTVSPAKAGSSLPTPPVIKRVHPCVDLETWADNFDPKQLAQRLADELNNRGLKTAADFKRPGANNNVVAAMQKVLGIEAITVLQSIIEEDK